MEPTGYVLMQHAERLGRPTIAYAKWLDRLPAAYRESVLGVGNGGAASSPDPRQIQRVRHYRGLMPMAMEARKPMFALKPSEGAIGAHQASVQQCREDFRQLALELMRRTGVEGKGTA